MKDLTENFNGEIVKTTDWKTEEDSDNLIEPKKKIINRFLGIFISITIGFFAGLSCKAIQESFIYSGLFFGECLICLCVSGLIKTLSLKNIILSFSFYFISAAISTPIAAWIGSKIV